MSDWLEHEAKAECLDLRRLRDENEHTIDVLRAENAEMKARLSIEWDGVANERDALRKENNELRAENARLKKPRPA